MTLHKTERTRLSIAPCLIAKGAVGNSDQVRGIRETAVRARATEVGRRHGVPVLNLVIRTLTKMTTASLSV